MRFIDYGNTQETNADDLRIVELSLFAIPMLAKECILEGVVSRNRDWFAFSALFEQTMQDTTMFGMVRGTVSQSQTPVFLVDLYADSELRERFADRLVRIFSAYFLFYKHILISFSLKFLRYPGQ